MSACLRGCDSVISGTPTEENWPGISSVEEFKSYNFPKYKPQPLINHAPRYCGPCVWVHFWFECTEKTVFQHLCVCVCVFTWAPLAGNPVEHFTHSHPLPSSQEPRPSHQPLPRADSKLLFLLSPPGWTLKASSCCFLSSKWVFTAEAIPRMHFTPQHFSSSFSYYRCLCKIFFFIIALVMLH